MNKILTITSKPALTAAIETNLFSLFRLYKQWPQAVLHDTPELMWTVTDIPFPLFNSVLGARLPSSEIDDAVDSIISEYKSKNVPMMWWIGPSNQPLDLGTILSERGMHSSANPGMAADLATLPESYALPKDLLVRRVEDEAELEIFCRVLTDVFGMSDFVADGIFDFFLSLGFSSPFVNYIGLIDDEIVATSSLLLAGAAGIYNVATIESARRMGVGAAMTAVPLLEARSIGYRVATLESSESGFNVYCSLGFQEYCKISHYIWMADQPSSPVG